MSIGVRRVNVELLRQSIAVCLCESCGRDLLFTLVNVVAKATVFGDELVMRHDVVDDVFFVVRSVRLRRR